MVLNQKRHGLDLSLVNLNDKSVPCTQGRLSAREKVVGSETSELSAVQIPLLEQLNNSEDEPCGQELETKDDNALISRISRRRQERLKSAIQKFHDSEKHSYPLSLLSSAWELNESQYRTIKDHFKSLTASSLHQRSRGLVTYSNLWSKTKAAEAKTHEVPPYR